MFIFSVRSLKAACVLGSCLSFNAAVFSASKLFVGNGGESDQLRFVSLSLISTGMFLALSKHFDSRLQALSQLGLICFEGDCSSEPFTPELTYEENSATASSSYAVAEVDSDGRSSAELGIAFVLDTKQLAEKLSTLSKELEATEVRQHSTQRIGQDIMTTIFRM